MKPKNFYPIASLLIVVSMLLSACDPAYDRERACAGIACAQAQPVILLHFVDNQGRDLFNPATPNHLDSARVTQINNNGVRVLPTGLTASFPRHHVVILPWDAGESVTFYLKLSETDQDTVTYTQVKTQNCCTSYQLKTFSYNGKAYTDSVAKHFFTVVK